ncbi:MAG: GNAT family N-acetyltransferase [Propionibacteriaceae bacterium]|nr:GNAT family N-acetyltransferase [Propionibacteriaceae bacterium]
MLRAHDQDLRTEAELDRATDVTRIGPLWLGRYAERGFVTYRDLGGATGAELDQLVQAAVGHFAADPRVTSFEWKTRGHDAPPDLAAHLAAAGLVADYPETVMIGEAAALAGGAAAPVGVAVRRAGDTGDLAGDVVAIGVLHRAVFGPGSPNLDQHHLDTLRADPAGNELWLAEAGGRVVSAGRLVRVRGGRFAGLFGGATDPEWRHAGIYRALTTARARSALAMGAALVYAECTEFSRPILARSGLVAVTTTTPYSWKRPSS